LKFERIIEKVKSHIACSHMIPLSTTFDSYQSSSRPCLRQAADRELHGGVLSDNAELKSQLDYRVEVALHHTLIPPLMLTMRELTFEQERVVPDALPIWAMFRECRPTANPLKPSSGKASDS
jgi:hypothetical protein